MRRGQNIQFISKTSAWLITLFFMRLKTSALLRNACDIDIFTTSRNAFSQHEQTLSACKKACPALFFCMLPRAFLSYFISHGPVSGQALLKHPGQLRHQFIHIVIDQSPVFVAVHTVQAPGILLQSPPPGNRVASLHWRRPGYSRFGPVCFPSGQGRHPPCPETTCEKGRFSLLERICRIQMLTKVGAAPARKLRVRVFLIGLLPVSQRQAQAWLLSVHSPRATLSTRLQLFLEPEAGLLYPYRPCWT